MGPPFCSSRFVAMVFLNAIVRFVPLNIFACFCNISFVFMYFYAFVCSALCVAFTPCVAPCMVHGIGMHVMHVMHHMIIIMFIIMFIMFIIDHDR